MKFVSVANDGIVRNNTGFHTVPGFKTPVKLTILVFQTRSYNPSWPQRTFFATEPTLLLVTTWVAPSYGGLLDALRKEG